MQKFRYLIEKIEKASFVSDPFKHIYIENFFDEKDFYELTSDTQITLDVAETDEKLFENLFENSYEIISFPGCITSVEDYLNWRRGGKAKVNHNACSSSGMVLRLRPRSNLIKELEEFLLSTTFNRAIAEKFSLEFELCDVDCGIQKYLDGYEISPHPDIRRKAATYMVNLNPHIESSTIDYHTQYLRFKDEWAHIGEFWKATPTADRDWVPWDWCTSVKKQRANNSIVLFSPSDDTLHAVRASYDHLKTQRTQLYGNLWYKSSGTTTYTPTWEQMNEGDFEDLTHQLGSARKAIKKGRTVLGRIKRKLIPPKNVRERDYR